MKTAQEPHADGRWKPSATIKLRPLTLVDDGDSVLVGNPDIATYVAVPSVGAAVIRGLQQGATLDEVTAAAELRAREPVDVRSFVQDLYELGFIEDTAGGQPSAPRRTAAIQQRRWLQGLPPAVARRFFTPAAWCIYSAAFLFCVACFALRPGLWPRPRHAFVFENYGLSLLLLYPVTFLVAGLHEAWHWLAARALGLSARFGVDRRFVFLVFETDLSQLWGVPRRQRYGPQLAGLAIDSLVLAVALGVEMAVPPEGSLVARAMGAAVLIQVMRILWQGLLFLRTDLYSVLVTATRTRNLWEVKSLLLRRAFHRLSDADSRALAMADPQDLRVGLWFRWLYLAGMLLVACYFYVFSLPAMILTMSWTVGGLADGPGAAGFWLTAVSSLVAYLPLGAVAFIAIRQAATRIVGLRADA